MNEQELLWEDYRIAVEVYQMLPTPRNQQIMLAHQAALEAVFDTEKGGVVH